MRAGALSLRDTEWSSWSSLLGWHVRGIWAPNSEGTDIHTVDASRDQTMVVRSRQSPRRLTVAALACMLTRFRQRCRQCLTPTWPVQAVGDAFNLVRLFAFPASAPRAPCKAFSGHARCGRPLFSACRAGWPSG